jgi:hypothetical protein
MFRDFHKLHPDEAYKLFCLTELLEASHRHRWLLSAHNPRLPFCPYHRRHKSMSASAIHQGLHIIP